MKRAWVGFEPEISLIRNSWMIGIYDMNRIIITVISV